MFFLHLVVVACSGFLLPLYCSVQVIDNRAAD